MARGASLGGPRLLLLLLLLLLAGGGVVARRAEGLVDDVLSPQHVGQELWRGRRLDLVKSVHRAISAQDLQNFKRQEKSPFHIVS